jgi:hypothetical protein
VNIRHVVVHIAASLIDEGQRTIRSRANSSCLDDGDCNLDNNNNTCVASTTLLSSTEAGYVYNF